MVVLRLLLCRIQGGNGNKLRIKNYELRMNVLRLTEFRLSDVRLSDIRLSDIRLSDTKNINFKAHITKS